MLRFCGGMMLLPMVIVGGGVVMLLLHVPPGAYLKWIKASTGHTLRLMLVDDIDYFQADGKYTRVVSRGGEGLIRLSLKELLLQLDPAQFAQVHRSSIVNLHAVERIDKDGAAMAIRLKGGRGTLAVSEAYARQFRQM